MMSIFNLKIFNTSNELEITQLISNSINIIDKGNDLYDSVETLIKNKHTKHEIFNLMSINLENQLSDFIRINKQTGKIYVMNKFHKLIPLSMTNEKVFLMNLIIEKFKNYSIKSEIIKLFQYFITQSQLTIDYKEDLILVNNDYYVDMKNNNTFSDSEYIPRLQLNFMNNSYSQSVDKLLDCFDNREKLLNSLSYILITNNYSRLSMNKILNLVDDTNSNTIDLLLKLLIKIFNESYDKIDFTIINHIDLKKMFDKLLVINNNYEKSMYSKANLSNLHTLYNANCWTKSPTYLIDVVKSNFASQSTYDSEVFETISVIEKLNKDDEVELLKSESIEYLTCLLLDNSIKIKSETI